MFHQSSGRLLSTISEQSQLLSPKKLLSLQRQESVASSPGVVGGGQQVLPPERQDQEQVMVPTAAGGDATETDSQATNSVRSID